MTTPQLATPPTYAEAFDAVQRDQAGPTPIADLRRRAFARFSTLGMPTTRLEQWRFTNVSPITAAAFTPAQPATLTAADVAPLAATGAGDAAPTVVFVNGRYQAALSSVAGLPDGVVVGSLASALTKPKPTSSEADTDTVTQHLGTGADIESDAAAFTALNTALFTDGALIRVPANVVVNAPIHLLFVTTPPLRDAEAEPRVMTHPRVLIVAGKNSQVSVVETYSGSGDTPYLTNAVTEVVVGANAVVDHYKLVRESPAAYHIGHMHLRVDRDANFSSHAITLGGNIVRNDVQALLDGEGVTCTLNGLYIADGKQLVDNHTTILHAKPHCQSYELYKGILDGEAHAVFNGKIIVAIDAQKTDAKQTNKALLLSEDAQINTKPELEIFADDVKCTHGATVGQLDADAMFYLRTRGLGLEQARSVLIHAFASDLLNRIGIEPIREQLDDLLLAQLPGSGGGTFNEHG